MKKNLILILIPLFYNYSFAQNKAKKPYLVKEFIASQIKSFKLNSLGGIISIEGGADSLVKVEVFLRPSYDNGKMSNNEIENLMNSYELEFTQDEGKLFFGVKRLKNVELKKSLNFIYNVKLPKNIAIEVNSGGGNINLTKLDGSINLNSSGGGFILKNLSGNVKGYTSGGGIVLKSCMGKFDLTTMAGNINISTCEGDYILKNANGKTILENIKGNIDANTKQGEINGKNIVGTLIASSSVGAINISDIKGTITANTLKGDIYANIPSIKSNLTLTAVDGNIKLDTPLNNGLEFDFTAQKIVNEKLNNFTGIAEEKNIKGKILAGGATVKLQANLGNIKLN